MAVSRLAAFAAWLLLLAFGCLYVAAAVVYPGGTWENPTEVGHSFLFNYYCDLMRPVALNGQPNPLGSRIAEWGQLVFALSLGPFFFVAPAVFAPGRERLGRVVRVLGAIAALAGVGVVLFPSWQYGQTVHGIMLLVCAVPAVTALVCVMIATWQVPLLRALALGLAVSVGLTIAIFVRQMLIGTQTTFGLAPLQRIDFALALAWMTATTRRSLQPL